MAEVCVAFSVPGPPGLDGDDGGAGVNGINAFTTTTANFNMPAEGADVSVSVLDSRWAVPTQKVYVAGAGYMEVRSKPTSTSIVLRNVENTASALYLENVAPGTLIVSGASISPAGIQGPEGTGLTGALLAAQNLNDVPNKLAARANMGLAIGTNVQAQDATLESIASLGTVADRYIYTTGVDTFAEGVLTAFARNLLDDVNAAAAIATLGLGTMATQAASAVSITGGNLVGLIQIATTGNIASINLTASGETKISGKFFTASSTLQSLLAAGTISPNAGKVRVVGNGGAVVLVSTPTIGVGTDDGQWLLIQGTSDANTVTLQDSGTLAGSGMRLGAATRLLGAGDLCLLNWDTALAEWLEVSFSNI